MKIKKVLLISTLLVLFTTACRKEGGLDGRSQKVTRQLQKKGVFEVYRISNSSSEIQLGQGYGMSYIIMEFGNRTTINFYPDPDKRIKRQYWEDPWNLYSLGDTQSLYLEYTFLHNLIIKIPPGSSGQKLEIVKNREAIPLAEIAGEYEVESGHTFNGRPGYVLRKFTDYSNKGNGKGPPIMTIELAEVAR